MIYQAAIKGRSPYLMRGWSKEAEIDGDAPTRRIVKTKTTPREEAEKSLCLTPENGWPFIPGAAFSRLLREAGGNHKMKGSRKSVKYAVPSAIIVLDEMVPMLDLAGAPNPKWEVDSRPVTIPATKGRIMRHRPRWNEWMAIFAMEIDEEQLPADFVHQLLVEGGLRIGVGDFRPEKGGPFGRFNVVRWSPLDGEASDYES